MNAKTKNEETKDVVTHPGVAADEALSRASQPGQEVAIYDPGEDAGAGSENLSREDYSVPFLSVLDAKSPQCAPVSAGGVAGAKAGMLFNSATGELFDGERGVIFVPAYRDHNYVEWIKRNDDGSGGGFVGIRSDDDPLVIELRAKQGQFGKLLVPNSSPPHELIETFYLFGLVVSDVGASPVIVSFKSTAIQAVKNFNTREMGIQYMVPGGQMKRPALWAHRWVLSTQYRPAKKAGQSGWYIPRLALEKPTPIESRMKMSDPVYAQAKDLYTSIKAGHVKVKQEQQTQTTGDDEVPF
jgi:hypothetical protein